MDTFFMGFQSEMFWGPSLRWESGRSWGTGCWSQTLHSPGKIWDCEFLPKCMFLCQGGAYGDRVFSAFLLFLMWVFVLFCFHLPSVWESLLASICGFLSERISQCVGVDLVCLSEESSEFPVLPSFTKTLGSVLFVYTVISLSLFFFSCEQSYNLQIIIILSFPFQFLYLQFFFPYWLIALASTPRTMLNK